MKSEKLYQGIAIIAVLIISAISAGADVVPWSSKTYTAYAESVLGVPHTDTDSVPPVSATDSVVTDPSQGNVYYAHSEVTATDMYVEVWPDGHATASFSGTYTANLPYFIFNYYLSHNFAFLTFNIDIQDSTASSSLFTFTSDSGTDFGTFVVQTPVDHDINVDFYLDFDGYPTVYSSSTLSYNMSTSLVPEPISSVLFITGGTLLAGRRIIRRRT